METREITRERGKTLRAPVILDLLAEELPDATIALRVSTTVAAAGGHDAVRAVHRREGQRGHPRAVPAAARPGGVAAAPVEQIEELIGSLGLFRQKAKNLKATAR
jgi:endonuclease III